MASLLGLVGIIAVVWFNLWDGEDIWKLSLFSRCLFFLIRFLNNNPITLSLFDLYTFITSTFPIISLLA